VGVVLRTNVYIDGFNLFYGCLKRSQFKWLNVQKMCELLLPHNDIRKIYYFTAKVGGTSKDPDKPQRQLAYIRALKTLPIIEIIDGHFISETIVLPLADGSGSACVTRSKEKRSDVNLACQLLWDAHCDSFDAAVIVSGDSDFRTPISIVKNRFRKVVGVLDPLRDGTPNSPMNKDATFYKPIRSGVLQASQFPNQLCDSKGTFAKPAKWWSDSP